MTGVKRGMGRVLAFCRREVVLTVAALLAVVSACLVPPDAGYLDYIDWRTLSLLFCLMAVMAGLQRLGVFAALAQRMLHRVRGVRELVALLVMLCFFSSMLITNDVALITFVPFAFTALDLLGGEEKRRLLIPVVTLQTVAANLGSMLTPVGNPQNLYLHSLSGLRVGSFIALMAPYAAISFLLLLVWIGAGKGRGPVSIRPAPPAAVGDRRRAALYLLAFALCLLTVAHRLDFRVTLFLTAALVAAADLRTFAQVDYALLATFAAFFIFIGNMGRVPAFNGFLQRVVAGRECVTAVLASQVISNVPAALLLSGFTERYRALIVGVNLGGLGTLIASMASLISFKLLSREDKSLRGRYLLYFTAVNLVFLAVLLAAYFFLPSL